MCQARTEAGAAREWGYDKDPEKVKAFLEKYPDARAAATEEEIMNDPEVRMVCGAAIPSERCSLGLRAMRAGKDYFTDKCPLTTLEQLNEAKKTVKETGRKYMCYFSERLHVEAAVYAGYLVEQGLIGRVIQVVGLGPHRESPGTRPDWFYEREKYGGILTDIGSHQIEQFLFFTGNEDAKVVKSQIANYAHPQYPELDDFGDCMLVGENGATDYFRVDWFTPDGLRTWGDGRLFLLGTEGYIELRKYINVGTEDVRGDHVFLVNKDGEQYWNVSGKVGYPFFGQLILDCLNRTENAMTQEHCFKAAELCVRAQLAATKVE